MKTTFGPFRGIRNTVDARKLGNEDLAEAQNVDIDDTGRVGRRSGMTEFSAGAADSLFSDGDVALFRRNDALHQLHEDGTSTEIQSGIENRVAYEAHNGLIYFSDGVKTGVYDGDSVRGWGVTPPGGLPDAAGAGGVLPAGRYMFALTYLRDDGEESGTGRAGVIEDVSGGIEFTNIPVSPDADRKVIYLTHPNGATLYRALVIDNSATEATYSADTAELSVALETQYKQPPPAGSALAQHNGRMLVAAGRFLLFSDPYRMERFDPIRQSYQFESAVRLVAPVEGGVYVGTDHQIVFMAGDDIAGASYNVAARYGAIPGTVDYVDGGRLGAEVSGEVAIFASQKGVCIGGRNGAFQNMTIKRYVYPVSLSGAGRVRIEDGKDRYIAALRR